ncbi:MAG: CHAD domain-containing protein [Desulfobacteraceae bacterium]|nr:CHAD domain-containing protein [Desulfobacteraceae bacterium]
MSAHPKLFILAPKISPMTVRQALQAQLGSIAGTITLQRLQIMDSFDWRLAAQGLLFVAEETRCRLLDRYTGRMKASASWNPGARVSFWWQMADSAVKEVLRQYLDIRALMLCMELSKTNATLRLLTPDQKPLVRLAIDTFRTGNTSLKSPPLLRTCRVIPARGHAHARQPVEAILAALGATRAQAHPLPLALEKAGFSPGHYSTKMNLDLTPSMSAGQAAGVIMKRLLDIMRANEAGMCADIDTEFLHDFRVAVRRARSLWILFKEESDPALAELLKNNLRRVGRATNALRDLDVYLLKQGQYEQMLPHSMRPDIGPLFEYLRGRRQVEVQKLAAFIASNEYGELQRVVQRWVDSVQAVNTSSAQATSVPLVELARRQIQECFISVLQTGDLGGGEMSDEQLHQLRIQCKRLRYALEFFQSLFDRSEVAEIIKKMKALQDFLGAYNDKVVQQQFLLRFIKKVPAKRKSKQTTLVAAVGTLIGSLGFEKERMRTSFSENFTAFSAPENQERFKQLLNSP